MVIAGLVTEGETRITNIKYIYRGYEDFVEKLKKL
jgi:UDP-N-acetylglucosamine enolpyruvyl transferase